MATSSSSSSGPWLHRKNDRREASSTSREPERLVAGIGLRLDARDTGSPGSSAPRSRGAPRRHRNCRLPCGPLCEERHQLADVFVRGGATESAASQVRGDPARAGLFFADRLRLAHEDLLRGFPCIDSFVSPTGPSISTPSRKRAMRRRPKPPKSPPFWPPTPPTYSSDKARARSTKVTMISCEPAVALKGSFWKRDMIFARPSAPTAVHEAQVFLAADITAEDFLAVEESHHGLPRLGGRRIEAHVQVEDVQAVLAIGGEIVLERTAAARAAAESRRRSSACAPAGRGIQRLAGTRALLAHRLLRDDARGADVLVEEGRRHGQRSGDVVEAVHLDLGRQQVLHLDLDAEQRAHGIGVLGAIQSLHRRVAGTRRLGRGRRGWSRASRRDRRCRPAVGCLLPGGGIRWPRSLSAVASHSFASCGTSATDIVSKATPPAQSVELWHSLQ